MAGLELLGGIGAGLTKGTQAINEQQRFAQQRKMQDETLKIQQANLGMLNERHGWDRTDRAAKQAEEEKARNSKAQLEQFMQEELTNAGDNPYMPEVYARTTKRAAQAGILTGEQLKQFTPYLDQARQTNLMGEINSQDPNRIAAALKPFYGGDVRVDVGQGKDEFGRDSPIYTVFSPDGKRLDGLTNVGIGMMTGVGYYADEQARDMKNRKMRSEIDQNIAQTGAARAAASNSLASARKHDAEARQITDKGPNLGMISTDGKLAYDLVSAGLAKTPGEAMKMIRADKGLEVALRVLSDSSEFLAAPADKKAIMLRETAGSVYQNDGSRTPISTSDDPLGLGITLPGAKR